MATPVKTLKQAWDVDSIRVVDDLEGIDSDWVDAWAEQASQIDGVVPFEGLQRIEREDLAMLEVRDSL